MKKEKLNVTMDPFQAWAHRWGRIGTVIALAYMVALPFIVCAVYGAFPAITDIFHPAVLGLLAVYIPVGISEAISYTPILGSASYLTFLTGNIMNLKVPVAVNALKISESEQNTPQGDAIAAVAVAVSSVMTIAILALAALFSSSISWVFELEPVGIMAKYILPALFGSMTLGLFASTSNGKRVVKHGIKGVLPVLIIIAVISLAARILLKGAASTTLVGFAGILIILMLPVSILTSKSLWKKGKIVVEDKVEE